jgi:hypothetical protein
MSINGAPVMAATVVAVDVGKNTAVLLVTDAARHRLFGPVELALTAPVVAAVLQLLDASSQEVTSRRECSTARTGPSPAGGSEGSLTSCSSTTHPR